MFISPWILLSVAIILMFLLAKVMVTSLKFEDLLRSSFKLRELHSTKFSLEIKFFTCGFPNAYEASLVLERIELLLTASQYSNPEVFNLKAFEKMTANLGLYHMVFTPLVT